MKFTKIGQGTCCHLRVFGTIRRYFKKFGGWVEIEALKDGLRVSMISNGRFEAVIQPECGNVWILRYVRNKPAQK